MKTIHAACFLLLLANSCYLQNPQTIASTDQHVMNRLMFIKLQTEDQPEPLLAHTLEAVRQLTAHFFEQIQYPGILEENGIEGQVVLKITMNRNGGIDCAEVLKSPHVYFDREVLRVIQLFDGVSIDQEAYRGKQVVYMPIKFTLQ